MNKIMIFKRKTLSFIVVFLTCISFTVSVQAADPIRISIDGNLINFAEEQPYIDENNRTMVPIRFISNAMGGNTIWYHGTQTVEIKKDDHIIKLAIGSSEAVVDGSVTHMDTKAQLFDGRTYVPLRFISEAFGTQVKWNQTTKTVQILTKKEEHPSLPPVPEDSKLNASQKLAKQLVEQMKKEINPKILFLTYKDEGLIAYDPTGQNKKSSIYMSIDVDVDLLTVIKGFGDTEEKIAKYLLKRFYPNKSDQAYKMFLDTYKTGKRYKDVQLDGKLFGSQRFDDGYVTIYINN